MIRRFLLGATLLFLWIIPPISAQEPPTEILLQPVHKDTPFVKRKQDQELGTEISIKMIKLKDNPNIKAAPPVDAAVLHYGEIKLGNPPQNYGILIDFEGQEKTVWPDSDGDKDYARETSYNIFKSDRYTGGNIYFAPMPLSFKINYVFNSHSYPTEVQMDLPYLIVYRAGSGDCLKLRTRTWFIGTFEGKKGEQQIAIVDTNDNGIYNDPDDMVFVDENFDLSFSPNEGKKIKYFQKLQLKDGECKVDFSMCPIKILLNKG